MKVKVLILLLLFGTQVPCAAQFFAERSAEHNLARGKWEKAYGQLIKLKAKDSANAVVDFLLSQYYLQVGNRARQLDSANQFLKKSALNFQNASQKVRDRWKRFPLDSTQLQQTRARIDSMAFQRAADFNTVGGYEFFLFEYAGAAQEQLATELLHEVAYVNALRLNTSHAFYTYLQSYPGASRYADARMHYEKLLYQEQTVDKRLTSYREFVSNYPASSYRIDAEERILERMTAIGTRDSFRQFLQDYPASKIARKAGDILFHLLPEEERMEWLTRSLQEDSLLKQHTAKPLYLIPVLHQGEQLFLDDEGRVRFSVNISNIPESYWCGDIQEEVLVLGDRLVNVDGQVIRKLAADEMDDIGNGFLLVSSKGCKRVVHKSGFTIADSCIQDARIISNQFLAMQKNDKWGIWSYTGMQLQPFQWDKISSHGQVVMLYRNRKVKLVTAAALALVADQEPLKLLDTYDSVQLWQHGLIWARAADFEGVLDQQLSIYVPFEKHLLTQRAHGIAGSLDSRFTWYRNGKSIGTYRRIQEHANWIALKARGWRLMHVADSLPAPRVFDSVYFAGPFAVGLWSDSLLIKDKAHDGVELTLKGNAKVEFISGQDSSYFLLVEQQGKSILYDYQLGKVMPVSYDKILYAGEGLFIVHRKEHKGLINAEGKVILPVGYDAIGTVRNGQVSVLHAMKFGFFDIAQKRLIKPEYYKNPWAYTAELLVVFKQHGYGFVDWNNKPQSDFGFDEIIYWNDTTALVKKNKQYMLYNIKSKKVVMDGIQNYKHIRSDPKDQLIIVAHENGYGVIHNHRGVVIPLSYSDVVNLGTDEKPLYFTEKHVEEASLFVVIYYNYSGTMLRKEVYEADDYELVYCAE